MRLEKRFFGVILTSSWDVKNVENNLSLFVRPDKRETRPELYLVKNEQEKLSKLYSKTFVQTNKEFQIEIKPLFYKNLVEFLVVMGNISGQKCYL